MTSIARPSPSASRPSIELFTPLFSEVHGTSACRRGRYDARHLWGHHSTFVITRRDGDVTLYMTSPPPWPALGVASRSKALLSFGGCTAGVEDETPKVSGTCLERRPASCPTRSRRQSACGAPPGWPATPGLAPTWARRSGGRTRQRRPGERDQTGAGGDRRTKAVSRARSLTGFRAVARHREASGSSELVQN